MSEPAFQSEPCTGQRAAQWGDAGLWDAPTWKVRLRVQREERRIELDKPFALIGAHPRCDIRIEESKLPPVVYLVVACPDRIEVWPTCPLAFPVWGRVGKNHVLSIGRSRIRLAFASMGKDSDFIATEDEELSGGLRDDAEERSEIGPDEIARSECPDPTARLILDWGKGPQYKSLNRNVTIIGEDHPSLIRLHNADLHRCDHGLVCFGSDVWLINLHPDRVPPDAPIVTRVAPRKQSHLVGGIHLWVEADERTDLGTLEHAITPPNGGVFEEPANREAPPATEAFANEAGAESEDQSSESGFVAPRPSGGRNPGRTAVSREGADVIMDDLTERLLETNARKAQRRQWFRVAGWAAVALFAVLSVVAILQFGVLPIVRSIYGGD